MYEQIRKEPLADKIQKAFMYHVALFDSSVPTHCLIEGKSIVITVLNNHNDRIFTYRYPLMNLSEAEIESITETLKEEFPQMEIEWRSK